jgi:hypothetical protein
MTPNKVIEKIDRLKPNSYSEEDKMGWINELDGMVKRLVFQWDEGYIAELKTKRDFGQITEEEYNDLIEKAKPYEYPKDMNKELLIPFPFDDTYALYLEAKIDYYNREYGNYNNSAMMFETQFNEYKKAYIREHPAKG